MYAYCNRNVFSKLIFPFISAMTEDGYEAQFQVNHLSHFLLTLELLPVMVDTAATSKDGRVVFVSSRLHARGAFMPGNMNAEVEYSRTRFYGNSKLYNVRDLKYMSSWVFNKSQVQSIIFIVLTDCFSRLYKRKLG